MKKDNDKEVMLVISTGFLLIYFIFSLEWCIIVSFVTGVVGVFSSYASRKVAWLWFHLARILGLIVNTILLTLVFYLVLFPVSLISRLFRKDMLMIKNNHPSYFIERNIRFSKESFGKTW